jgi:hypothetical protein
LTVKDLLGWAGEGEPPVLPPELSFMLPPQPIVLPEDQPAPANLPRIWQADELLLHRFPERRWAVPGLIPEGLSLLAGKPKVGKSWLALTMALGVAHGGRVLGQLAMPEPLGVLYLALEDSPLRLQERHGQQIGRWHVAGAVFSAPRVAE